MVPLNFQQNTNFINETGLYELLTKSNKPIAKVFMNKYFTEIMPTIRKTGKYILKEQDKEKLDKINEKLNNYKKN
jgi:prophage antirepressor-like protein